MPGALSYTRHGGELGSHSGNSEKDSKEMPMSARHRAGSPTQGRTEASPESASLEGGACFGYKLGKRDSTSFCAKTLALPAVPGARKGLLPSIPIQHRKPGDPRVTAMKQRT